MVTVEIGARKIEWSPKAEREIAQELRKARETGCKVCVIVRIQVEEADLILGCRNCSSLPGGSRQPSRREEALFNEWNKLKVAENCCDPGRLIAFLKTTDKVLA